MGIIGISKIKSLNFSGTERVNIKPANININIKIKPALSFIFIHNSHSVGICLDFSCYICNKYLEKIIIKARIIYSITRSLNGVRRTPPRKIPPRQTPPRKILPRQTPPWWLPLRNIAPGKTPLPESSHVLIKFLYIIH